MLLCLCGTASEWHAWKGNGQLPSKEVYALAIGRDGSLLIGTDRGLCRAERESGLTHTIELTDPFGNTGLPVKRICTGHAGAPDTIITHGYMFTLAGDSVRRLGRPTESMLHRRHAADSRDASWSFDTRRPSLAHISSGGDTLSLPETLAGLIVTDITNVGSRNIALAANNDGVFILNLHTGAIENHRHERGNPTTLPRNHVMAVAYDTRSRILYAAVPQAGLWWIQLGRSAANLLMTDIDEEISCLVRDREGHLWVGYDGAGIQVLDSDMTQLHYFSRHGDYLPSDIVTALLPLDDGQMMVATYGAGLFTIDIDGRVQGAEGLSADSQAAQARSMATDAGGNLWIATFTQGVVRRDTNGKTTNFRSSNSALRTDYITDLAISPEGDSIFVATGYGLYGFDAATLDSHEIETEGNRRLSVRQIAFDSRGRLRLATPQGLLDRRGHLLALDGIPVKALKSDDDGGLWCSSDSALYRVDSLYRVRTFRGFGDVHFGYYALLAENYGRALAGGFGVIATADINHTDKNMACTSSAQAVAIIVSAIVAIAVVIFIIARRHRKKAPARIDTALTAVDDDVTADADRRWLAEMKEIVDRNLSDSGFGVEQFSAEARMSRSNLYKKLTALTKRTPQEFIRDRRVAAGRRILEENRGTHIRSTLSETAFRVGMSPRQFSKYLKESGKQ